MNGYRGTKKNCLKVEVEFCSQIHNKSFKNLKQILFYVFFPAPEKVLIFQYSGNLIPASQEDGWWIKI